MKNYQKPIVLLNSELSEGVYTASGDTGRISVSGPNETGEGYKVYSLTIDNTSSEEVNSVSGTVQIIGHVTDIRPNKLVEGVEIICTINGDGTATITYVNNAYGIEGNGKVDSVPVIVYGSGEFGIM